jgi:hypothetical protein
VVGYIPMSPSLSCSQIQSENLAPLAFSVALCDEAHNEELRSEVRLGIAMNEAQRSK